MMRVIIHHKGNEAREGHMCVLLCTGLGRKALSVWLCTIMGMNPLSVFYQLCDYSV